VLSGGNALGAYAAGAYESLHLHGFRFDVIAGASIGAINGAIIAGNGFDHRLPRLREFWTQAATGSFSSPLLPDGGKARELYSEAQALQTLVMGRPGLFAPRVPGLLSMLPGMPSDVALFDHRIGARTLERLVDFDLLNSAKVPLMIDTVDLQTGECVRFDNRRQALAPAHFLASTAMPPFYPPIEIDGRLLGDPGLIGNLPLDAILDSPIEGDTVCFAIDAFTPNGEALDHLNAVSERAQDILFAAQSHRMLQRYAEAVRLRRVIADLSREGDFERDVASLVREGARDELTVVRIAYRAPAHEGAAKMLDFSRASIEERWRAGRDDMERALGRLDTGESTWCAEGFTLYDVERIDDVDAAPGHPVAADA
jgi:NTE family protein